MNTESLIPPLWPSRRLWLKFFIGFVYVPLLFSLAPWMLLLFAFSAADVRSLYLILFFLLLVGGPISIGLLLSSGRRGVSAGLVTVIAILIIWFIAGIAIEVFGSIGLTLQSCLVVATSVILLEIMTGDVRSQAEMVGLGIGLAVGLFLVFVNNSLVDPFYYSGEGGSLLFYLYLLTALIWLNALFFPEWVSRKVGWRGVIIWITLISMVFAISFMLMR